MKKRLVLLGTTLVMMGVYSTALSADLLSVYKQALVSDPSFKEAEYEWYLEKENLPIAMAQYLPQISASATASRNFNSTGGVDNVPPVSSWNYQHGWFISLTQPIFNFSIWESIKAAGFRVKAATATYAFAQQDLMTRTAEAYFNVLQASDQLRFTRQKKEADYRQLVTAQEKFKVGLIAITDVYNAKASYDQDRAAEIADRNQLANRLEELRAITGEQYRTLMGLNRRAPLITPRPDNIEEWVKVSEVQNYNIQAQAYAAEEKRQQIYVEENQHIPTVNFAASYSSLSSTAQITGPTFGNSKAASFGITASIPILEGGAIVASTRQARYNYLNSSARLEFVARDTMNQARQAFLNVKSQLGKIQADAQTIISTRNSYKSTQAEYSVGTRTMVDVLIALTDLYQAEQQYSNDQYAYIINIIKLKEAAGTLCVNDLAEINSWLKRRVEFNFPSSMFGQEPGAVFQCPCRQLPRDQVDKTVENLLRIDLARRPEQTVSRKQTAKK